MDISVIIPTLNEAQWVARSIDSARDAGRCEIIVCDGGSTDATAAISSRKCPTLVTSRCRSRQMNMGAERSSGEVLVFLHADTLLPTDAFESIRNALRDSSTVAGCFRLQFDVRSPLLNTYAALTRLPLRSLCFGDRTLFVRRAEFEAVGGFPAIPLFEDLEMVKLLSRRGRFRMLPQRVTTSARRFVRLGPARQQLLNALLWTRYQFGASPDGLARFYMYETEPRPGRE